MAGVHPVPRRLREAHARQPVADGARRARRPDPRRARRARLLRRRPPHGSDLLQSRSPTSASSSTCSTCCRSGSSTAAPSGARRAGSAVGGGREQGDRLRTCSTARPPRCSRRRWSPRTCRSPGSSSGRPADPRRRRRRPRRARSRDRARVPRGFEEVDGSTGRPSSIFGSARVAGGHPAYEARASRPPASPRRGWAVSPAAAPA